MFVLKLKLNIHGHPYIIFMHSVWAGKHDNIQRYGNIAKL